MTNTTPTTVTDWGIRPVWNHWEDPKPDDLVEIEVQGQVFRFTRADALRFFTSGRGVVGVVEVLA